MPRSNPTVKAFEPLRADNDTAASHAAERCSNDLSIRPGNPLHDFDVLPPYSMPRSDSDSIDATKPLLRPPLRRATGAIVHGRRIPPSAPPTQSVGQGVSATASIRREGEGRNVVRREETDSDLTGRMEDHFRFRFRAKVNSTD